MKSCCEGQFPPYCTTPTIHSARSPLPMINHHCRHVVTGCSVLKFLFGIVFYFEQQPFVPLDEDAVAFGRAKRFLGNGRQDVALAWPDVASPAPLCSSQYQAVDSGRLSVPAGLKLHVCHITAWGGRRLARPHAVWRCHENLNPSNHLKMVRRRTFKRFFELFLALEHEK